MTAISLSLANQVAVGAACGVGNFLFSTVCQKTCMLAGVKFAEIEDEDDVPASEQLDKHFWDIVVKWPIAEELVFRAVLQPSLANGFLLFMPQLAAPALLGIPIANVVSTAVVGTGFGIIHYFAYKSGGKEVALIGSITGSSYGMIKERFGLATSISAHIIHNFMTGWLDKHYPAFLDSSSKPK